MSSPPLHNDTDNTTATAWLERFRDRVKVVSAHDTVYKNECVYSFHNPFTTTQGLVIDLQAGVATHPDYAFAGYDNNNNNNNNNTIQEGLFLRVVQRREAMGNDNDNNKDNNNNANNTQQQLPTKLALGGEGGFATDAEKYNVITKYSIVHLKCNVNNKVQAMKELPYLTTHSHVSKESDNESKTSSMFPEWLVQCVDSIRHHSGSTLQQQVQTWQMEQEELEVSKYAANLPFVDNGVQISSDPATWKCEKSGDSENVWLNLSTGYMGGGRQHWDGSGGSNGALDHFQATGQQYPLVVKLGTIATTQSGANKVVGDCYSYAPDEDGPVLVPNLGDLLEQRGIAVGTLEKTAKSTAELEVELNAHYAFDAITEQGLSLVPRSGPLLQGLQNLGNSCYLNSVVQVLFHLTEYQQRYANLVVSSRGPSPTAAPLDLLTQTRKLAHALCSGEFAKPLLNGNNDNDNNNDNDDTNPKYRLAPRMFKHVVGKDHVDFQTGQQQDAAQFLQYYLELLDRAEQKQHVLQQSNTTATDTVFYPSSHWLSFATETRSVCTADQKVKYDCQTQQRETIWSLAIPMDQATVSETPPPQAGGPPHSKRHKVANQTPAANTATSTNNDGDANSQCTEATASTESPDEPVPQIDLSTCLDHWAAETTVEDISWPHLHGAKHAALRTTRLANCPKYLCLQLQRYTLGPDWQPLKLQVELQLTPDAEGRYRVDLTKYRAPATRPANQVLVPDEPEGVAAPSAPVVDEAALSQLMDMGFSLNSCKRALNAVGGSNVEAAMGWVFEHNTDPDFNDPLPEGGAPAASGGDADEAVVQSLVEMLGCFTADQVRFALKETNGASDRAADWLFSHMDDLDALMAAAASNETSASSTKSALPPLDDNSECGTYQLQGMISHIGKHTGSGHYVAHLYLQEENKWVIFNDEKVAESEKPPVEHAYLYLFQRTDTL